MYCGLMFRKNDFFERSALWINNKIFMLLEKIDDKKKEILIIIIIIFSFSHNS